jgi:hypothetical protein
MAANNIRVHTDANYRIRDDIAPLMQSSRYFNKNNCIGKNNATLRRNIISDSFVQPYTQKLDDGSCDYTTARQSELEIGNLNYYNRPQNYETQLGLTQSSMKQIVNSKLDQAYNLPSGQRLDSINQNKSSTYYPYAYGNNLNDQTGNGVMGGFQPIQGDLAGSSQKPGYYEPYMYRVPGNRQVLYGGGTTESNFGQFNPQGVSTVPVRSNYKAVSNSEMLSYAKTNPGMRSYAGSSPKTRSKYGQPKPETFVQQRPREGFFFESNVYPVNNYGGDYKSLAESVGTRSLYQLAVNISNTNRNWKGGVQLLENYKQMIVQKLYPNAQQTLSMNAKGVIHTIQNKTDIIIPTKEEINGMFNTVALNIPGKYPTIKSPVNDSNPALTNMSAEEKTIAITDINKVFDTLNGTRTGGPWITNTRTVKANTINALKQLAETLSGRGNNQIFEKIDQQGNSIFVDQEGNTVSNNASDMNHDSRLGFKLDAFLDEITRTLGLVAVDGEFNSQLSSNITMYNQLYSGDVIANLSELDYSASQMTQFDDVQDEMASMNLNTATGLGATISPDDINAFN